MSTTNTLHEKIPDEVLDQLLAGIESRKPLLGPAGLLRQLTGRLVEKRLEAELTAYRG